jgi:hypothetical protein
MPCGKDLDDRFATRANSDAAPYDIRDLHQAPPLALMNGNGGPDPFQPLGSPGA